MQPPVFQKTILILFHYPPPKVNANTRTELALPLELRELEYFYQEEGDEAWSVQHWGRFRGG